MVECHRMLVRYLKTCLVECPQCPPSQSIGRANDFSSGHIKCKTVYGVYDSMLASSTWNAATKVDSRRHEPSWTKASGIWTIIARTRTIHHRHPFWKLKQNSKSSLTSWQFKFRNCHHIQLCDMWNSSQELIQIILLWTWVQRQQTAGDWWLYRKIMEKEGQRGKWKYQWTLWDSGFLLMLLALIKLESCQSFQHRYPVTEDTLILHHQPVHDCLDMFSWLGKSSVHPHTQPMWPAPQKSAGLAGLSSTPWSTKNKA